MGRNKLIVRSINLFSSHMLFFEYMNKEVGGIKYSKLIRDLIDNYPAYKEWKEKMERNDCTRF